MTHDLIDTFGSALEVAGVAGVARRVGGLLLAFARAVLPSISVLRQDIGRAILLGLEVLVAADIVRTVASQPTMESGAVLALIVAIRTFLSWSLALELDGRWPWQRAADVLSPSVTTLAQGATLP